MKEICNLVAYNASLLLAHWAADTKTNEHNALGALYEEMTELTDKLAEVYMGKSGEKIECTGGALTKLANPPADGLAVVESLSASSLRVMKRRIVIS